MKISSIHPNQSQELRQWFKQADNSSKIMCILYLHSFDTGSQLRAGLKQCLEFYNKDRSHQALDNRSSDEVYFDFDRQFINAA